MPPALFTALGYSAATAATISTVIQVGIAIASVAYSRQQAKKQKKALKRLADLSAEAQDRTRTVRDPIGPRRMIYGECRVGGTVVFNHNNGGSSNAYKHVVIAIAGHEVTSFSNLQFDDEVVTLNSSGEATGRYAGYVTASYFLGSPSQTSNAALMANCPEVWTSDHKLQGIAGVYIRFRYDADLFPNGIPNVTVLCRGRKVFDPRTSLTSWSNNAALCLNDYLTSDQEFGGMGFDYATDINHAELIASANNSDELVELTDGSFEKRYTLNGAITSDTVFQDSVDDMVEAMAGKQIDPGGVISIISGYYRTPTITFTEDDLREGYDVQTAVSRSENFNAARGTFISPQNYWQAADFVPVTNETYEEEDGNVQVFKDFAFSFTTSNATCQRLAKIQLEKIRQGISVRWPGKLTCLRAQVGDVVGLTIPDLGWTNKVFEVVSMEEVYDESTGIGEDLTLRETASTVYDWNDGEETTADPSPNTDLPSPFDIAGPTDLTVVSDGTTTETEGSESINRMKIVWTQPADEIVVSGGYIRVQYRPFDATTWRDWGLLPGYQTEEYVYPVLTGVAYVVRIRSENRGLGIVSSWVYSDPTTSTGDTTAPDEPSSFTATGGIGGVFLEWTNPADSDLDHIDIYEATTNTPDPSGGSTPLDAVGVEESPNDEYFRSGLSGGAVRYYWIRAVDTSGNKSDWVGPQGATAAVELSGSASPDYVFTEESATAAESGPVTASPIGGVPTFAYEWEYVSGDAAPYIDVVSTSTATTTFSGEVDGPNGNQPTAVWRCKITDSAASIAYTQDVTVEFNLLPP